MSERDWSLPNDEWFRKVKRISTIEGALRAILDNESILGYDGYYGDMRNALLEQAEKVLKRQSKKKG